jgi:nitrite reductase/ring-hydroxylating ferredoxin subunit
VISCDGIEVGVFNIGGELVAWYNQCAHRSGPVCQGRIFQRVLATDP